MNTKVSMILPEDLLKKAMKASGSDTKTGAVIAGLNELLRKQAIQGFTDLRGSKGSKKVSKSLRRR